ncbi:branched-chain amino acid ABC transporter permease [Burkholderia vietnamiensis]|uniref:branched-chain amino acid ABC transporter permease n=1 Tax=Burkholderia vietnamiensis TaxID=60552 RepID=UPI0007523CF1|nr:branched-chain amino acid ABC transporter permease [Burkholderia vietnamiensis]KVG01716.1 branched-chain amino acid ABC transporter permease [Burkholderia vietnamiensis]MBR8034394.1 branched-chain amino acid ABC transporter permease [Burkholderia vietnamiensis]WHU96473.1 branched-chain amino acid ABC transporter permease [Burkholderia vietnamiensis]CAG9230800.1 Branched-chain amino acid ABC transporter permease [Burkholderia vietnamiensis]HDR8963642.1 branched-chain amino acid ABC transport
MLQPPIAHVRRWLWQPAMNIEDISPMAVGVAIVAAALILPFCLGPYLLSTVRDALIMGLLALSYDLLWGRAGVLTLGHTTFFGLGAYGFAVATVQFGQTPVIGFIVGLFGAMAVAVVLGYFLLFAGVRLHFFAIISMAVLIVVQQLATSWQSVTGGDTGLLGIPGLSFSLIGHTVDLSGASGAWYMVAAVLAMLLLTTWLVCRSRYGKVLSAIATNEWRAKACGYHTSAHLLLVFTASAGLAAVAGVLMAACSGVVAPDVFSPVLATEVILWVAIGGRGTLGGPVLAAVALTLLKQTVSSVSTDGWPLLLGGLFLGCVLFLPNGVQPSGLITGVRRIGRIRLWRTAVRGTERVEGGR